MIELPPWLTIDRSAPYPKYEAVQVAAVSPEDECNNGSVNTYVKALDENGGWVKDELVFWATPDEAISKPLRPEGELDYCFDEMGVVYYGYAFEMSRDSAFYPGPPPGRGEHGPYSCYMRGASDIVKGMGLPFPRQHYQFIIVFQYKRSGGELPIPPGQPDEPDEGEWMIKRQTADRIVLVRK